MVKLDTPRLFACVTGRPIAIIATLATVAPFALFDYNVGGKSPCPLLAHKHGRAMLQGAGRRPGGLVARRKQPFGMS